MTIPSTKKRTINSAARLLPILAAVAILSTTSNVEAKITCGSPSGSHQVGDTVSLSLSDDGIWPKAGDASGVTANIRCSSGGNEITSFGMTNSW
ncbi:hypothetical protein BGZ65_000097, partial [Modicella reniformis]